MFGLAAQTDNTFVVDNQKMNIKKLVALVALVICLSGCGQHSERLTQLPNGQYRIDTITNGVLTKTRLYDREGKLIPEGSRSSAG